MNSDTTPPPDRSPDRITPGKALEPETPVRSQPGTEFQSFMQGSPSRGAPGAGPTQAPTPLDMARPAMQTEGPTANTLLAQARNAQDILGTVQDQLNTPNLKLKRSQAHLLRNKLGDANTYVRAAAGKLGIDTPTMKMPTQGGALERFMAYVNDGQEKLASIQGKLSEMSAANQELRPGDMMLIQIKMGQAQQEIEYSSTLLSKVIDSIKQIFNIQL